MKNFLFLSVFFSFFIVGCNKDDNGLNNSKVNDAKVICDTCAKTQLRSSNYGIYGFVFWPVSGTPYNVVESPTIHIFKWVNGAWVSYGNTIASACGYYTYETGSTGTYRALVNSIDCYYLRSYPGCSTRADYGVHAGSGDGQVTILSPWTQINVRCS